MPTIVNGHDPSQIAYTAMGRGIATSIKVIKMQKIAILHTIFINVL